MDKKIILFGAGKTGQKDVSLLGKENIAFFVDNNPVLWETEVLNLRVKNSEFLREIDLAGFDIVISVSNLYQKEIENDLNRYGISYYKNSAQYLLAKEYCFNGWSKYRNFHKGESCFLLGSGPSLRVEDLNKLKDSNIVCFAANKIFKIFSETNWRPTYYISTDRRILEFYQEEITNLALPEKFIAFYTSEKLRNLYENLKKQDAKIFEIRESFDDNQIDFSSDPEKFIVEGRTVMYAMIQLAAYMGFSKMYLLGVDFTYTDTTGYDKNGNDHFCKDYIEEGEQVLISPKEYCLKSFNSAEEYSKKHGFRVYNATRGGKLEVFERVDFDVIVKEMYYENVRRL